LHGFMARFAAAMLAPCVMLGDRGEEAKNVVLG